MRSLDELRDKDGSVIRRLRQWAENAVVDCSILPPSPDCGEILCKVQITTGSMVGSLAYETGGILVDHGWLRFLGSGHPRLPRNLADWNAGRSQGYFLIADDAAGGFFALNRGAWGDDTEGMYYWAPDNLDWEPIGFGPEDFFQWCLTPYIADFYQNLRWPTWKQDVAQLSGDRCFCFHPPLWTREGSILKSDRRDVPVGEAFDLKVDLPG